MSKKIRSIVLLLCLLFMLAGCGSAGTSPDHPEGKDGDRILIVTTIFPEYDWVREVLGERAQETDILLLCNGVDMHSYQPSVEDIMKIADCDLFIYVGGESDSWVGDVLTDSVNPNRRTLSLLELLGDRAIEEEELPGMKEERGEEEEAPELDEHVWLSLRNAELFVSEIALQLSGIDPDHADEYMANAAAYIDSLTELDAEYYEAVDAGRVRTVLFGDRFPFLYLTEDYGISCYAAFAGCSAEAEASFETIAFLAQKANELQLHTILKIEGDGNRIADTIARNTSYKDTKVLVMDSMQGTTLKDIKNGASYLSIMKENLSVLKEALQ